MTSRVERRGERGHLMVGLVAAVAILMIFSTIVFQEWSQLLRREAEEEMMFRAKELVRGIQRYRLDHGQNGPAKLDLLLEPGPKGQYYIRHLYKDPLVKDGKWGLLYQGPGGTIVDPTAEEGVAGLDPSLMDQLLEAPDTGTDELAAVEGGGLTIAGVKSLCTEEPFRVYNGFTKYSEWRFTYLDLETGLATTANAPGTAGGLPNSPVPSAGGLNGGGDSPFGGDSSGKNKGSKGGGKKGGGKKGGQKDDD